MDLETIRLVRTTLAVLAAAVYVTVGVVVGRREVSLEARPANRAFQLWWFGLAGITLLAPFYVAVDLLHVGGFALRLAVFQVALTLLVVAVASLLYYLLYVYTGRSGVGWLLVVYAILLQAWIQTTVALGHPYDYGPHCPQGTFWTFCYEHPWTGTAREATLVAFLLVPLLLGVLAYFAIYFRLDSREQRYRVATVAVALGGWFSASLVASLLQFAVKYPWWPIASQSIALCAASAILAAYRPPAPMRRWLASTR